MSELEFGAGVGGSGIAFVAGPIEQCIWRLRGRRLRRQFSFEPQSPGPGLDAEDRGGGRGIYFKRASERVRSDTLMG